MEETIQFRQVERRIDGATIETWWEYRTRALNILGVLSLGPWSAWKRVDLVRVDQGGALL